MNEKLKQFFERMKKNSLKADEKSLIKTELMFFMDKKPIPYSENVERHQYIKNPSYIRSTLIIFKKPMTALIIGLLLLGSGATSFAAEQAVPGDTLYPIKVSVNEKVIDALKVSDESKANWEAKKAERRVKEIAKIVKKKKITNKDAIVAQLEKQFDSHTAKVNELLAKLENAGDTEKALRVSKRFEDILNSQEDILRVISDADTNSGDIDEKVLEHVGNVTEDIAQKREDREERIAEESEEGFARAASNKLKALNVQIERTEDYINKAKSKVGEKAVLEAIKKLDEAKLLISLGEEKLSAGEYKEAFGIFKEARKKAHEAKRIISKWRLFKVRDVDLNKDGEVDFEDFKKQIKDDEFKENKERIEKGRENERENEKDHIGKERENEKDRLEKNRKDEKNRSEKDREDKKDRLGKEKENNKQESEDREDNNN